MGRGGGGFSRDDATHPQHRLKLNGTAITTTTTNNNNNNNNNNNDTQGLSPALRSRAGSIGHGPGGGPSTPTTTLANAAPYAPYRADADFGPLALIVMEGEEVTILLPEDDLPLFPPGALVACPLRWTPIKLCGRRFDFHETGVVSAMSKARASPLGCCCCVPFSR